MAEGSSLASRQLLFDLDGDTPVPAAEVLIDLKESARRRNNVASPRKRRAYITRNEVPKSTHINSYKTRSCDEKGVCTSDGSDGDITAEAGEDVDHYLSKRSKVSSNRKTETEGFYQQSWSVQMKTFLRLPKALTWCRYEWFCSDIDRPFFGGDNDFCQCLDEMFPRLKARRLSLAQWRIMRRMIGKPRRCSSTFFVEERMILGERRRKVRELQRKIHQGTQLSSIDFNNYRDLPDTIPAILTLGTRVTAWLNNEKEKGFYIGTVEAVDLDKHQYWVTFDKPGVGKHSVYDYDIKSMYPTEPISLSLLETTHTSRQLSSISSYSTTATCTNEATAIRVNAEVPDPLLASLPASRRTDFQQSHSLGGFPTNFLRQVVQMSKLLSLKQDRLKKLSILNTDAEKIHARHGFLSPEFQKHYATVVIDLDDINRQLNLRSEAIKKYTSELGYQDDPQPMSSVQECMEHATSITDQSNVKLRASGSEVTDSNILKLVAKLSSILLQVEMLSHQGCSHDLSGLQTTISEAAASINSDNKKVFMKHIDTPLALIQSGMDPSQSLHPFSVSAATRRPHRTNSGGGTS